MSIRIFFSWALRSLMRAGWKQEQQAVCRRFLARGLAFEYSGPT